MSNTLSRRTFLASAAVSAVGCATIRSTAAKHPNILFVMTDQEPTSCLGCYGNDIIKTPARDSLARDGVRFNNHYIAAFPCSPSRAAMITGRYSHNHGIVANDMLLSDDVPAMGGVFGAAGYETGWVGKSHIGGVLGTHAGEPQRTFVADTTPEGYVMRKEDGGVGDDGPIGGFKHWVGGWTDYKNYLKTTDLPENIRNSDWIGAHTIAPSGPDSTPAYSEVGPELHMAHFLTDHAVDFIKAQSQADDPFCLVLSYFGPHHPVAPPKPYDTMYRTDQVSLPSTFAAGMDGKPATQSASVTTYMRPWWSEEQFLSYIARYYGYVTYLDDQLQRVLDVLRATGQEENTIVVFTSDHGDMLGEFGHIHKLNGCGYDTLMKVPLIIRWPKGLPKGRVCDGVTSMVDIFPTLLDMACVAAPDGMDGKSMRPLAEGETDDGRDEIFISCFIENFVVRQGPWKFVLNAGPGRELKRRYRDELYNLDTDPKEVTNLVETMPDVADRLCNRILEWLEETNHPYTELVRARAQQAPVKRQPIMPNVTAFTDLGDGKFRFAYGWDCTGPLEAKGQVVEWATISRWAWTHSDVLWRQHQITDVPFNEWTPGTTPSGTWEGMIEPEAEPGEYDLNLGFLCKEESICLANGRLTAATAAKITVSRAKGKIALTAQLPYC